MMNATPPVLRLQRLADEDLVDRLDEVDDAARVAPVQVVDRDREPALDPLVAGPLGVVVEDDPEQLFDVVDRLRVRTLLRVLRVVRQRFDRALERVRDIPPQRAQDGDHAAGAAEPADERGRRVARAARAGQVGQGGGDGGSQPDPQQAADRGQASLQEDEAPVRPPQLEADPEALLADPRTFRERRVVDRLGERRPELFAGRVPPGRELDDRPGRAGQPVPGPGPQPVLDESQDRRLAAAPPARHRERQRIVRIGMAQEGDDRVRQWGEAEQVVVGRLVARADGHDAPLDLGRGRAAAEGTGQAGQGRLQLGTDGCVAGLGATTQEEVVDPARIVTEVCEHVVEWPGRPSPGETGEDVPRPDLVRRGERPGEIQGGRDRVVEGRQVGQGRRRLRAGVDGRTIRIDETGCLLDHRDAQVHEDRRQVGGVAPVVGSPMEPDRQVGDRDGPGRPAGFLRVRGRVPRLRVGADLRGPGQGELRRAAEIDRMGWRPWRLDLPGPRWAPRGARSCPASVTPASRDPCQRAAVRRAPTRRPRPVSGQGRRGRDRSRPRGRRRRSRSRWPGWRPSRAAQGRSPRAASPRKSVGPPATPGRERRTPTPLQTWNSDPTTSTRASSPSRSIAAATPARRRSPSAIEPLDTSPASARAAWPARPPPPPGCR